MRGITPFLSFNDGAEEAVKFYTSIFQKSKVIHTTRYGDNAPQPKGTVMTIRFQLGSQEFIALNGASQWAFTEAISFVINCESQAEIDAFWAKLPVGGGQILGCGWLKDRFGVCWQVVPTVLWEMMQDKDAVRVNRVMQALWQMTKLDIEMLKQAYEGES